MKPLPAGPVPLPYPTTDAAAPPDVPAPIPSELLSADLQSALVRLAQKYRERLQVQVTDPEWVQITVDDLSVQELLEQIQHERRVLFGDADSRMQVIPQGTVVFLHLLSAPDWSYLGTGATAAKK